MAFGNFASMSYLAVMSPRVIGFYQHQIIDGRSTKPFYPFIVVLAQLDRVLVAPSTPQMVESKLEGGKSVAPQQVAVAQGLTRCDKNR